MARRQDFEDLVEESDCLLLREDVGWHPVAPPRLSVQLSGLHPEFRRFEDAWMSQEPISVLGLSFRLSSLEVRSQIGSMVEAIFTLQSCGRDMKEMG